MGQCSQNMELVRNWVKFLPDSLRTLELYLPFNHLQQNRKNLEVLSESLEEMPLRVRDLKEFVFYIDDHDVDYDDYDYENDSEDSEEESDNYY